MTQKYREDVIESKKVKLNYITIVLSKNQIEIKNVTFVKDNILTYKQEHRMFESLNLRLRVVEDGFEDTFFFINSTKNELYEKSIK